MIGGVNINWEEIKNEYINGKLSQKCLAKSRGVPLSALQKEAKKGGWYALKRSTQSPDSAKKTCNSSEDASEQNGLECLAELVDRLADKLALAIEQLGSDADGGIIDAGKLRQLVRTVKDLSDFANKSDDDDNSFEEKQAAIIEVIRRAVDGCGVNLAQDTDEGKVKPFAS